MKPKPAASPRPQPVNQTRRHLLRWLGLGGMGVALAAVVRECWPVESVEPPFVEEPTPSPTASLVMETASEPEPAPPPEPEPPAPTGPNGIPLSPLTLTTVQVNDRGDVTEERSIRVQVYDEDLGGGLSLRMVEIPGGSYMRGQTEEERQELLRQVSQDDYDRWYARELPRRQVTVPRFFMGMFQITQAQYAAVMGENPSYFLGDSRPVERVNWNDAKTFCDRLSDRTGRRYFLPTEAEWEYACRAGTTAPFHFGPTLSEAIANYNATRTYGNGRDGTYRQATTNVSSFPANDFGLYDMHGNVWEWCADHYRENYDGVPTDGSPYLTNNNSGLRMLRGGSWLDLPRNCRSALCVGRYPDIRSYHDGFRVVVSSAWTPA